MLLHLFVYFVNFPHPHLLLKRCTTRLTPCCRCHQRRRKETLLLRPDPTEEALYPPLPLPQSFFLLHHTSPPTCRETKRPRTNGEGENLDNKRELMEKGGKGVGGRQGMNKWDGETRERIPSPLCAHVGEVEKLADLRSETKQNRNHNSKTDKHTVVFSLLWKRCLPNIMAGLRTKTTNSNN